MKKNEIEVGECYIVVVNGVESPVRILYECEEGGWMAKSLVTGLKTGRFKSARRFRRKCTEADLAGCKKR